jgi:hypothetical protein
MRVVHFLLLLLRSFLTACQCVASERLQSPVLAQDACRPRPNTLSRLFQNSNTLPVTVARVLQREDSVSSAESGERGGGARTLPSPPLPL